MYDLVIVDEAHHLKNRSSVSWKLVNELLVVQPKVILPMAISNRTAAIARTVVCDVCGQPGDGLHLCTGGHPAHAGCLAPQCVDCKRVFCQLCADQLTTCVVCGRPVCRPSLITCPTCGRGTCHEHQQLCHAADGAPAALPEKAEPAAPKASRSGKQVQAKEQPLAATPGKGATSAAPAKGRPPTVGKPKKAPPAVPKPEAPSTKAVRMDVQILEDEPLIVIFAMRSTNRRWATRSIELTPQGILVKCMCEKSPCPADGYYHRLLIPIIEEQIEKLVRAVQQEYWVPAKKVSYYYANEDANEVREEKRFALPALWREPARLAEALRGFDEIATQ